MNTPRFIYPFSSWGTFGLFAVFGVVNEAVITIFVMPLGGHMLLFLLSMYLVVELLGHRLGEYLTLVDMNLCLFQ